MNVESLKGELSHYSSWFMKEKFPTIPSYLLNLQCHKKLKAQLWGIVGVHRNLLNPLCGIVGIHAKKQPCTVVSNKSLTESKKLIRRNLQSPVSEV